MQESNTFEKGTTTMKYTPHSFLHSFMTTQVIIYTLIAFQTLIILSCKQQKPKQLKKETSQCLLIQYHIYSSCKILHLFKDKPNFRDSLCGDCPYPIDDWSEYFPLKKVLYISKNFQIKKSTQALLFTFGKLDEIDSLPNISSKYFVLYNIIRDSIAIIEIDHKKYILPPYKTIHKNFYSCTRETDFSSDPNASRLVLKTTFVYIKNEGLIQKKNIYDNNTWFENKRKYNLDAQMEPYQDPDSRAEFKGDLKQYIQKHITTDSVPFRNCGCFQLVIDSTGKVISVKVIKSYKPDIDKKNSKIIDGNASMDPGNQQWSKS